eukprot:2704661-Rhodomonas_salina.1
MLACGLAQVFPSYKGDINFELWQRIEAQVIAVIAIVMLCVFFWMSAIADVKRKIDRALNPMVIGCRLSRCLRRRSSRSATRTETTSRSGPSVWDGHSQCQHRSCCASLCTAFGRGREGFVEGEDFRGSVCHIASDFIAPTSSTSFQTDPTRQFDRQSLPG